MKTPIRILVVDDHAVVRSGLRLLLETQEDLRVVGEANSGTAALARCGEVNPNLVLMDIGLPGLNGLEATRAILAEHPDTRVLILTMHEDDAYFSEALAAGACGYVLKESPSDELLAGIRAVTAGGGFFHPALARRLAQSHGCSPTGEGRRSANQDPESLTEREHQIVHLTAQGKSNSQIAQIMFISPRTVERHRSNLMIKLGFSSRADLIRYAVEQGLVDPKG